MPKSLLRPNYFLALLGWLLLCAGVPLFAQPSRNPNLILHGTLTRADHETYRTLPFTVPTGTSRITVDFSYSGHEGEKTTIDLGLLGPEGFRGWSGGDKSSFTISASDATPSYLPGKISQGTWKILLGVPNLRPGVRSEYTARIFFDSDGSQAGSAFSPALRPGPGRYRGDLHMHTGHSDGNCSSQAGKEVPCPAFKILEAASARHLDFIAVTDHNTLSHYNALRELAPYFDRLLLLHGREITTFQGHVNVYGTDQFVDFRVSSVEVPDMNAMLRQVRGLGAIASINHPSAPSGEQCMGCGWTPHPEADLHLMTAVEAINGYHSGTEFWEAQLNRGYRLTGIGGSDSHNPDNAPAGPGAIGTPTTVIYATELSEAAILDGIRAGHVFIDLEGSADRWLEFEAMAGTQKAVMGDSLRVASGSEVDFQARFSGVPDGQVEVIEDGKPIHPDAHNGSFSLQSDGQRHWFRINIRSPEGKLLLVGNPIYMNF